MWHMWQACDICHILLQYSSCNIVLNSNSSFLNKKIKIKKK